MVGLYGCLWKTSPRGRGQSVEFSASWEIWVSFCGQWQRRILSREHLHFWGHQGSWLEGGETLAETGEKAVVIALGRKTTQNSKTVEMEQREHMWGEWEEVESICQKRGASWNASGLGCSRGLRLGTSILMEDTISLQQEIQQVFLCTLVSDERSPVLEGTNNIVFPQEQRPGEAARGKKWLHFLSCLLRK